MENSKLNDRPNERIALAKVYLFLVIMLISFAGLVASAVSVLDKDGTYMLSLNTRIYLMIAADCIAGFSIAMIVLNLRTYINFLKLR